MRAERLLRIVMVLQSRGQVTAAALARELAVSTRTIKRDMDALSSLGIPVYATRGQTGGWRLVESYRTSLTGLTASDALSIVVGRSYGILSDLGLDDPGDSPIRKLLDAIAPSARAQVEHARQRIHVDIGPWGGPVGRPDPSLSLLQKAIWDDRVVRVRYGTAPASVRLAPLGLVRHGATWYLVAHRGAGPRTYRVSRIQEVIATEDTVERPDDFDLVQYWDAAGKDFLGTRSRYVVQLRLRGDAVIRAGWVYGRHKEIGEPDEDGWVPAIMDLGDADNAQTVVRQLGGEVLVVAPADLRESAVAYARQFVIGNAGNPV